MGVFHVTTPDGHVVEVNAPDGASEQDAINYAQQNYSPQSMTPTPDQLSQSTTGAGVLNGVQSGVVGAGQLVPRAISEISSLGENYPNPVSRAADKTSDLEDATQQQLLKSRADARTATGQSGIDWPQMGGQFMASLPTTIAAGGVLPEAATLGGRIAQGAATGMASATTAPVDTSQGGYAGQKTMQMGIGAGAGAALPAVGAAVSGIINPVKGAAQQVLQDAGVRLTPGQAMGGAAKTVENSATSIPLMGDQIKNAYSRGYDDFNRGAANQALSPIGQSLPDGVATGNDSIAHVHQAISDSYNKIVPQMKAQIDPQLQNDFAILQAHTGLLPQDKADQMQRIMSNALDKKVWPDGTMTGDDAKQFMSTMQQNASAYSKSQDPDQQKMGQIFSDVKDSFSQMLQRNNPPELSQALNNTDASFAHFIRLQKAAASVNAAGNNGIFSPAQLLNAVKSSDQSLRKGAFAEGNALMQKYAVAGQQVLPSTVPDSGTFGRSLVGAAALGGAHLISPPIAALGAAGAAAYTRPGQAMARLLMARPDVSEPIAGAISKYSNPAALAKALMQLGQ